MPYRIVLLLLLLIVYTRAVIAEEPVSIPDSELKEAVEEALGGVDPTPSDMLGLAKLRCYNYRTISDLTGLEYAVNLQTLVIRWAGVSDLSPLSELYDLRRLLINNNQISDLSPLSDLCNLEVLDLHNNEISDVSPLENLSGLEKLFLRYNQISDISSLSALTNLETLDLQENDISDISALSSLAQLDHLDLNTNSIEDISALSALTQLTELDLGENDTIVDLSVLSDLTELQWLNVDDNSISDLSALTSHTNLDYLNLRCNPLSPAAYEWDIPEIEDNNPGISIQYDVVNTASLLDVVYVDDDAPGGMNPSDATVDNAKEDGTRLCPFDSIQEAIDQAKDGASIVVLPGIYYENISLLNRRLTLRGADPNDTVLPVLFGGSHAPVVSVMGNRDMLCGVSGFVLAGGTSGIHCRDSHLTVEHCVVEGAKGVGIHNQDNTATVVNCTIAANTSGILCDSSQVTLTNCIVWYNHQQSITIASGLPPYVEYSNVETIGALQEDHEYLLRQPNTHDDPLFMFVGNWDDRLTPDDPGDDIYVLGDYHLQSVAGRWEPTVQLWIHDDHHSPCIDAGNPLASVDYEPDPNGKVINMGVYGGTEHASKSMLSEQ